MQRQLEVSRAFRDSTAAARDSSLDVARGLGILLVLYGHSLEALFIRSDGVFVASAFEQWRAIYAFHMPLFFLISGRAHALSGRREIPWVRAGSLVLLALANHLIGGVFQIIDAWRHGMGLTLQTFKHLLKPCLLGWDFSLAIMWFLVSLAAVQLLFSLWQRRPNARSRPLVAAICAASFVAATILSAKAPNLFQIKSWLPGLVFFALGCAVPSWRRISPLGGALCLLAAILLAPLNHGCSFAPGAVCAEPGLQGHFAVWMFLGQVGFVPWFYVSALLGCAGVMALSQHIEARALTYCGKNSLYLFLVNSYVLAFGVSYLKRFRFSGIGWLGYVGMFGATVAIHLALLLVTRPWFKWLEHVTLAAARSALGWLQGGGERHIPGPRAAGGAL